MGSRWRAGEGASHEPWSPRAPSLIRIGTKGARARLSVSSAGAASGRAQGWPPAWRGSVQRLSGHVADGERGLLNAVHRDLKDQSFPLARRTKETETWLAWGLTAIVL